MKKQKLQEALAVLLTKLSSARDNPLLIDNYAVKALRTTLVTFKESGELHEALKEKIRRMKMELQELEETLDKCEDRDNRYDDEENYRRGRDYDRRERDYDDRDREYGRGRYGRY